MPDVAQVRNYGWPCYEGAPRMGAYDALNLDSCETPLRQGAGAVTAPYFAYNHADKIVPGESCTTGSSSISGLAFYTGDAFPAAYQRRALLQPTTRATASGSCPRAPNGLPDPATRQTFAAGADGPVWLHAGPGRRALLRRPRRAARCAGSPPPTTRRPRAIVADADDRRRAAHRRLRRHRRRPTPRARRSRTPGTSTATARTTTRRSRRRRSPTRRRARHRPPARDRHRRPAGHASQHDHRPARRRRSRSPRRPRPRRGRSATRSPSPARPATAPATPLPASALTWSLALRHCSRTDADRLPHAPIQDYAGVASGSFVAPDHEYPSHLQLVADRASTPPA